MRSAGGLRGVVEDKSQRVALSTAQHADPVAHRRGDPSTSGGCDRPVSGGENDPVSLGDRARRGPRLRAWALLDDDELAAGVVGAGIVESDDDLEWEDEFAVEVPVERVPVAGAVAQHERGGSCLT